MREPAFWWRKAGLMAGLMAGLLAPLAGLYGAVTARRMRRPGARVGVPVVCVGNFTLGGAGKTPTAIALSKMLSEAGERVFCLSRGYGGRLPGPKRVDAHGDFAAEVGDEALLLARAAPTIIARDRVAGAEAACAQGAGVIVMDDGLQNGALAKDFTLAVVDGPHGVGNGRVFPAGPLRVPLAAQMAACDAVLVVGDEAGAQDVVTAAGARGLPVWHGRLKPDLTAVADLHGRQVLAFAGIGHPDKFFATVSEAGIAIARRVAFADHHRFTAEQAAELMMEADEQGLSLITTEKDRARMAGDPLIEALAERTHVLPVSMAIEEVDEVRRAVLEKLRR